MPERIQKWLAYKKTGLGLINTAQEGRLASGQAPINTIFNGFDDTVKAQAIQAIQLAIDSVEQTASSITGVFRERLNGIQQKDAVTNVQISQNNSFIITKQYYQQMDLVTVEILTDCLNEAKIVFKNGLTGNIILGDNYNKIFTALPENFTVTDYDIRLDVSSDVVKDIEQIKQVIPEFIKSGALEPDIIFDALTAKSVTGLKAKVAKAMKIRKEENNQLQQVSQQAQQLQQQLQQAQKELQSAQQQIESLNQQKMQLDQKQLELTNQLEWFKARTDQSYKQDQIQNDKDRIEIQKLQIYDGNPYNDKVKQAD